MRKRGRKGKRQKQLLSHCLSFSGAFYVHVSVVAAAVVLVVVVGGVMGKAGCQIKLCCLKSFMAKVVGK